MFFIRPAGHKFVDRGDALGYDYILTDFIRDEEWHSLDISSKIPKGAKLVMLRTYVITIVGVSVLKVKTNGNAADINIDVSSMETDAFSNYDTLWVVPDADGKIEYWLTDTTYAFINVTIAGGFV